MAHRWYGLNKGQSLGHVATGSSALGKHVQVDIDLAIGMAKSEVIKGVRLIRNKILEGNWPPAIASLDYFGYGIDKGENQNAVGTGSPTAASATVTCASVAEADTVTIGGVVLTAQDLREKFTVLCVADVAGSLNNTYFDFNTPVLGYRVWINVNSAGVAPAADGRTLVEVAVATGATNAQVATAVSAAIDALATVTASVSTATVTAIMTEVGACTDAVDGATPTGFTITVTRQGAASPSAAKFSMNTSDTATGDSLAAAVAAEATIAALVTAVNASGVVTLTAIEDGTAGNAITLVSSNGTRLAVTGSGTLASGAATGTGKDIRVEVKMAYSLGRNDVFMALKHIEDYIIASTAF